MRLALALAACLIFTQAPAQTISALPPVGSLTGSEYVPVVQNGTTYRALVSQFSPATSSPGGASGQLQYNNGGSFGGFALTGDCIFSVPTITCTKTNGTPFAPSATSDTTNANNITTGTLPVSRGGTGAGTLAVHGVMIGQATSAVHVTTPGTAGQVLTSNGSSADPTFQPASGGGASLLSLVGSLTSANFNITSDQAIGLTGPAGPWIISSIVVTNCSTSLTTAKGTFYAAASKTGVIAGTTSSTSTFTGLTSSTAVALFQSAVTGNATAAQVFQFSYFTTQSQTIYLSLTTPQGAAATCDIYVIGMAL